MLNDADVSQFKHVYVFVGCTDLRKGIQGLSTLVKEQFHRLMTGYSIDPSIKKVQPSSTISSLFTIARAIYHPHERKTSGYPPSF